ncbi:MAG: DNA polymerase processivity component [Caudoviricetes sp.]|nr:MAG: DNA polymerase processivity component [Caudoviricetes sp.]
MKISTNTINVLKNFAKINPSMVFPEGNVLKTISPSKTIMSKAIVQENFPKRFAVYNLNQLISTVSLVSDPVLKFTDNSINIVSGNEKFDLVYTDETNITKAPDKEIVLPSVDVSFTLTQDLFNKLEKAAGVLSLPEVAVVGDGSKIYIQVYDSKNATGNTYSVEIGETTKSFKAIFKLDNLKLISGDYEVTISSKGISHFLGKEAEYWIAVEQHSVF